MPTFPSGPLQSSEAMCYHPSCALQQRRKPLHRLPRNLLGIFSMPPHIFSPAQTPPPSPKPSENPWLLLPPPAPLAAVSTQLHHSPALSSCTPQGAAITHHAGDEEQHPFKDQEPTQDSSIPSLCCKTPAPFGFLLSPPTLLVNPLEVVDIVPSLSRMFLSPPQKCCLVSRVPGWKYSPRISELQHCHPNQTHSTFGRTAHKSQLQALPDTFKDCLLPSPPTGQRRRQEGGSFLMF